jgi:hypothetical protein
MNEEGKVREEMPVVAPDQQVLGTVEEVHGDGFDVQGFHMPLSNVASVEGGEVRLAETERVHMVQHRLEVEAEYGVNAPLDADEISPPGGASPTR